MKGSKCKCGYATTSVKTKCPRCGREMKPAEWDETGKVLSYVGLQVIPQGLEKPHNIVLVEIEEDGPKIICWTVEELENNDEVIISETGGKYLCSAKSKAVEPASKLD